MTRSGGVRLTADGLEERDARGVRRVDPRGDLGARPELARRALGHRDVLLGDARAVELAADPPDRQADQPPAGVLAAHDPRRRPDPVLAQPSGLGGLGCDGLALVHAGADRRGAASRSMATA